MIYLYECSECGVIESNEEAFNPRPKIKCECGEEANRVFTGSTIGYSNFDTHYNDSSKTNSANELSKGDKQFLARKGITGRQWDNMTQKAQGEWRGEIKNPCYDQNDKDLKTQNNIFKY